MAFGNTDLWVVLRPRYGRGAAWLEYADSLGRRRSMRRVPRRDEDVPNWRWRLLWPGPLWLAKPGIRVPGDFDELINECVSALPMRYGPHANGPKPLPIFVAPPQVIGGESEADAPEWFTRHTGEQIAWEGLSFTGRNRVEVVRLARQRWTPRPRFRLPLRLLAVGPMANHVLGKLRNRDWYTGSAETQQFGMQFTSVPVEEAAAALRATPYDLVIGDDESVPHVLRAAARLPQPALSRPRLVIHLSQSESASAPLPAGMSLLTLPPRSLSHDVADEFIKDLVYGIIHDYPLHEAVKAAKRQRDLGPLSDIVLVADPVSNNDLRLSDALDGLQEEVLTISQTVASGDLPAFFERMGEDAPPKMRAALEDAFAPYDTVRRVIDETRNLKISFQQEVSGMVPMSYTEASMAEAKQSAALIESALAGFLKNRDYVEAMRKHQERRVDVALEYQNEMSAYLPADPRQKLTRGAPYRLRVHIGQRADGSLVVGEVPPIDPLLPETEACGHTLDVVVFEKDFILTGPSVRSLYLPLLGGTSPAYFDLRAPESETAELRLGVYHRNHLLQSFVLTARVGVGEYVGGDQPQVAVRPTFSRTARFTNLDKLGARALSIGTNADANGGHTFMFKRDGQSYSLGLATDILAQRMKEFRGILSAATYDASGNARFPTDIAPGTPLTPDFEEVIRQLADLGNQLYDGLFVRATRELEAHLNYIAEKSDETIQIVRLDPNYAFPWPVVYDYALPDKIIGAPPPPVCTGLPSGDSPKTCPHGPDVPGYCIYGFWGVRHCVEQLLPIGDGSNDADPLIQANPNAAVRFVVDAPDKHTTDMIAAVRQSLAGAAEIGPDEDLLDLLWEPQKRPTLLVVLGHLETRNITGEPAGARIVLRPQKKWLQAGQITFRHRRRGPWPPRPQTMVLLMACGSGATDIATLNDFFTALTAVGAAAIVGTECAAFTRLVARFARDITLDIWKSCSLGEAIKRFNRRMISAGNPLAFVFTYLGDADLTVVA